MGRVFMVSDSDSNNATRAPLRSAIHQRKTPDFSKPKGITISLFVGFTFPGGGRPEEFSGFFESFG